MAWQYDVAPFTGAWIETRHWRCKAQIKGVAPFTGAWIETCLWLSRQHGLLRRPLHGGVDRNCVLRVLSVRLERSPPSRGRGSKPNEPGRKTTSCRVAPFTGAWIETPV